LALLWIIIGATFDFFDGMSARLLKVSSPIGKELDSLADDVTFGVAPSTILFSQLIVMDFPESLSGIADYLPFAAYIMAAFSALRLAKFNLDERQTMGFIGLPTPANALFWGSLIVGLNNWLCNVSWGWLLLIVMMLISSWLLVSEIPMFALKFKHWGWKGNELRYCFIGVTALAVAGSITVAVTHDHSVLFGFLRPWCGIILLYLVLSVIKDLIDRKSAQQNG
jgi:CDP-diacylglycerol--serine O-phosphatidyltransferase